MKPGLLRKNKPQDRAELHALIDNLTMEKDFIWNIKEKRPVRSISQNNLYWLWVGCIVDETDNSKAKVHLKLGMDYLPLKQGKLGNEPVSTTTLDTLQFKKYLDQVQEWAKDFLNIKLPDPDDLHFREFFETYKEFINH